MKSARTAAFETLEDEEVRSIEDETSEKTSGRYESLSLFYFFDKLRRPAMLALNKS